MSARKKLAAKIAVENIKSVLLLQNVKKCIEQYFLFCPSKDRDSRFARGQHKIAEDLLQPIKEACLEILLCGLKLANKKYESVPPAALHESCDHQLVRSMSVPCANTLQKLIEDFEWLQRSTQIGESIMVNTLNASTKHCQHNNLQHYLHNWTLYNLQSNCLCACLQALVADRELLECYYREGAFLRNNHYATALFVCLSALELNQCSLLTQVEPELRTPMGTCAYGDILHKRANSQPDFLVLTSPNSSELSETLSPPSGGGGAKRKVFENRQAIRVKLPQTNAGSVFTLFRKVRSLPLLPNVLRESRNSICSKQQHQQLLRPRSKTVCALTKRVSTLPKNIPATTTSPTQVQAMMASSSNTNSSSSYSAYEDEQPSTSSAGSKRSQLLTHNRFSPTQSYATTTTNASNSTSVSSMNSSNSTSTARRIDLIKCDDIKIWTDQSWERKHQYQQQQSQPKNEVADSGAAAHNLLVVKPPKGTSPINNFLCQLFGSSPTYTHWSNSNLLRADDETEATPAAALDINSYPCNTQLNEVLNTGGVFDSFRPVYGTKLRSRKSQSIFDEDCTGTHDLSGSVATSSAVEAEALIGGAADAYKLPPKNCQNLTTFLQMTHMSTQHNNTELEKENAHFRISEAIISAIEHIKWSRLHSAKHSIETSTASTATDWLEKDRNDTEPSRLSSDELTPAEVNEHIPYAELEECSSDALSAEVVGLSLIAKFNDKHLPKVSELKWLVSEGDAPQALLPMPDINSSCNPDEHVVPSVTRGTRYWAPPRQQIIFTDHSTPNRKELVRKQNNRCAGCGMRVSTQHIQSFRYCTYLGKYHCTACHRNQMSVTPARILQFWDFKCYPVSVFAYRLLEQMYTYPLFHVPDLNPTLYIRNKELLTARNYRVKLQFVKDFVKSCRFAVREQRYFDSVPTHITEDPDIWSMSDFVDAHEKRMKRSIEKLIFRCENHIFNCVLCAARGFICECCRKEQVIYPWQNKVFRCDRCGSCYHQKCWISTKENCCRCQRMHKRQIEINEQ